MNQAADAWLMRGITKKVRELGKVCLLRYFSHASVVVVFFSRVNCHAILLTRQLCDSCSHTSFVA